ncbi:MAG: hypothetical protein PHW34_00880 [Hespellia sp.]|nr:hypothetical protein [Hespellia sp.]
MKPVSLDFKWYYETRNWMLELTLDTETRILNHLEELSDYVELPFSENLTGRVLLQSQMGLGETFDVHLKAVTTFDTKESVWKVTGLEEDKELSFHTGLGLLTRLAGQNFPIELIPDGTIKELCGSYQGETENEPDKLEGKIVSDQTWQLFGNLTFGELGVSICNRGEYGYLCLLCSLSIGESRLPIQIDYELGALSIAAERNSLPFPLPALSDFGGLFGLELATLLPKEIISLGNPQLENLLFVLAPDLKGLERLEFSFSLGDTFSLMGIKSLTLSEVGMDLSAAFSEGSALFMGIRIHGSLCFEKEKLELMAFQYGEKDSWVFSGTLYNGNRWGLLSLWELLEMGEPPEILKKLLVPIQMILISYDLGRNIFSISARFENDNEISMEAEGVASGVNYKAQLSLAPAIRLSSLPVVGTHLHMFDDIFLSNINLLYCTQNGIILSGSLNLFSESLPFSLCLAGAKTQKTQWSEVSDSEDDSVCYLKVKLHLGALEFSRVGIGCEGEKIIFLVDASLVCSGLSIRCLGLGVAMELSDFRKISFGLQGMELSYITSSFSMGGSFYRKGNAEEYEGSLLIKAGDFSLQAIGSYSEFEGKPSIFAYGVLLKALGGPPAFFITGVAVGFGYQQILQLPKIEEVQNFPLLSMVFHPGREMEYLRELKENYVRAEKEQMWIAAGVRFTSFQMIDCFALLTVSAGKRVEIALLGLGEMRLKEIAYAALALQVIFCPEDGIFSMMAVLTKDSYIFSSACRLTGGFAFLIWYGGLHAGDFVLSMGGYHPDFVKPEHYPNVERIGFVWEISSHLTFSGELYFTLTPACMMAGGGIDARYENGNLKAWFYARADFIMYWQPFYYQIGIEAGIGVSYRVDVLFIHHTFKIELSASLRLWGPEFTGKMKVSLWIISFTISFGSGKDEIKFLGWKEFLDNCIYKQQYTKEMSETQTECIELSVASGLLGEGTDGKNRTVFLARSEELSLVIKTKLPNNGIQVNEALERKSNGKPNYVLPMGGKELSCFTDIQVERCVSTHQDTWECVDSESLLTETIVENLPQALWGKELTNGSGMVEDALTGVRLRPAPIPYYLFPEEPVDLDRLAYEEAVKAEWGFYISPYRVKEEAKRADTNQEFSRIAGSTEETEKRKQVIGWLNQFGMELAGGEIGTLCREAENLFVEQMTFCQDQKA